MYPVGVDVVSHCQKASMRKRRWENLCLTELTEDGSDINSIFLYYRDATWRAIKRAAPNAIEPGLISTFELITSLSFKQHEILRLCSRLCSYTSCLGNCILCLSLNIDVQFIFDRPASFKNVLQWTTLLMLAMQPSMEGKLFKHLQFGN